MKNRIALVVFLLGLGLGSGRSASAGFVATAQNVALRPSSTATMDILIRSTEATPRLDGFVVEFRITPLDTIAADVSFPTTQENIFTSDPNYVFKGDSALFTREVHSDPPRITIGDATLDGLGVDLSGPGLLLARLELTANASALVGSRYAVRVFAPGTQFQDPNGDDVPYVAGEGIVTIAAVPEPGALALTVSAGACLSLFGAARRRRV